MKGHVQVLACRSCTGAQSAGAAELVQSKNTTVRKTDLISSTARQMGATVQETLSALFWLMVEAYSLLIASTIQLHRQASPSQGGIAIT